MSIFPHVILLSASWDQSRIWGVHLCHKDPKSIKKWLSYGYFSTERLCDFIESHMGPKGGLGCSFLPIISKLVKTWLSYSYFPTERLRDFIESHMGPKGILGCTFAPKTTKISQEMAELWLFSTEGLRDFIEILWDQRGSLGIHLCQKDPTSVKKWLSYGYFPT